MITLQVKLDAPHDGPHAALYAEDLWCIINDAIDNPVCNVCDDEDVSARTGEKGCHFCGGQKRPMWRVHVFDVEEKA